MAEPLKEGELDPQTRARAKKALHEKNTQIRQEAIEQEQADMRQNKDNPAVQAILRKARALSGLHLQMAKDGVGIRATGERDENGQPISENIFFTKDKRMTELDKSAGIDELLNWAERVFGDETKPVPVTPVDKAATTEDASTATPPVENGPAAPTA